MKYVLILYLCSFLDAVNPSCTSSALIGVEFNKFSECITEGYRYAYGNLKEIDMQEIEDKKLAIKFECKKVKITEVS